jgi:hypothetical protein
MKLKTIKIKVNPFEIESGHADWKRRKQGALATHKGAKVKRAERNRVERDECA